MHGSVRLRLFGFRIAGLLAGLLAYATVLECAAVAAQPKADKPAQKEKGAAPKKVGLGRELFSHPWVPGDRRSHGGDGLGPVFNERSCVGCHHQGGPGGGGTADKNIEIITPVREGVPGVQNPGFFYAFSFNFGENGFEYRLGSIRPWRTQRAEPTVPTSPTWCKFIRDFATRPALSCTATAMTPTIACGGNGCSAGTGRSVFERPSAIRRRFSGST